ncbi:MAG: c-type cytochrome [Terriglobales bacterium]
MKLTVISRATVRTAVRFALAVAVLGLIAYEAKAQQAPMDDFKQNCATCHSIGGGRLTGPDLKDVSQRKDRAWLTRWLQDPKAVIDSGDPYGQKLLQDSRGVVMPAIPGMNAGRAGELLDLIDSESKLPRSKFAGSQISDRPFTAKDVAVGRQIFTGTRRLAGAGPACVSCHTVRGLGGLGGGRLGPDLTLVYERLQGRKGLSAWLGNPASPTMAPVFRNSQLQPDEILPLVAFFEDAAKKGGQDDSTGLLNFFLIGMGVMVVGLVSLDSIWKKRIHGVRRQLVGRRRSRTEDEEAR